MVKNYAYIKSNADETYDYPKQGVGMRFIITQ